MCAKNENRLLLANFALLLKLTITIFRKKTKLRNSFLRIFVNTLSNTQCDDSGTQGSWHHIEQLRSTSFA